MESQVLWTETESILKQTKRTELSFEYSGMVGYCRFFPLSDFLFMKRAPSLFAVYQNLY